MSDKKKRLFDDTSSKGDDVEKQPLLSTTTPKSEEAPPSASVCALFFRYATWLDVLLLFIGTLAAAATGATMPLTFAVFGNTIQNFVTYQVALDEGSGSSIEDTKHQLMDTAFTLCMYYAGVGVVSFVTGFLQTSCFLTLGERLTRKIRLDYFYSLLSQEISWFDEHKTGDITTRVINDTQDIQDGISDKTGQMLQSICGFLGGLTIGLVKGPIMTLVLMSVFPILAIGGGFVAKSVQSLATAGQNAYAEAGSVAEEVFSSIRTVVAFGGEKRAAKKYTSNLTSAYNTGVKKGLIIGGGLGFTMFVLFCSYGLAFWYGGRAILKENHPMNPGDVMTVFFAVIIGAFAFGQATPGVSAFLSAKAAAGRAYAVIDRASKINPFSRKGSRPEWNGEIEFENVHFNYPSRPDVPILRGLSFKVEPGKTLALVGASGCGKSTVISLLEKFYEPSSGTIMIDGQDIHKINTQWLRTHLGIVSQEPALFAMSIRDNIALGKMDGEEPSQQEIEAAAREANAHSFITQLPNGYDTLVGEHGAQLSGGQKQRIAIARALIKKPKILLLDEATSALDSNSEKIVQEALDKASKGRTTIVIAHRLSTIQNADHIAVVNYGQIIEFGTHSTLMAKPDGVYASMVKAQAIVTNEEQFVEEGINQSSFFVKSDGSQVYSKKNEKKEEEKEPEYPITFSEVFSQNKKEWPYLLFGLCAATVNGTIMPAFSKVFSTITSIFTLAYTDESEFKSESLKWSLAFIALGLGCALANFFQSLFFAIAGERLTRRLRKKTFKAMVRQPIGWFDTQTTGKLTTKLANDASLVQSMLGTRLASFIQACVSMSAGLVLAFLGGWQMTLVVLGCVPFIVAAGAIKVKRLTGYSQTTRLAYEKAGSISTESIENIRTVAALAKERHFWEKYRAAVEAPHSTGVKRAQEAGFAFGLSQCFMVSTYAVGFYFGAYMMSIGKMEFQNVMQVFSAVVFSAMAAGQATAMTPDYAKAKDAASSIFRILNTKSDIDATSGKSEVLQNVKGEVQLERIGFSYPTRPNVQVAKDLSIHVKPGKTVALVGPSGCGKSTAVSLILRFYDPNEGRVLLERTDIRSLNVQHLRQQAGIVSQEPVLFAATIKENIAYGKPVDATMDEIETAAKAANIHDFIMGLPDQYNTYVGEKGTQLSGGQKQRIAIARALVRNPKILLLDEATSALDTESEKVVQEALDKASIGRTTVIIAHRLSTIQNADTILVIQDGKVAENGTHQELLSQGGLYCKLVKQQQQSAT